MGSIALQEFKRRELRNLIHDDEMDCKNMATLMEIEFWRKDKETYQDSELAVLGGYIANLLRVRAEASKAVIDFLRDFYPLFMDKEG